MATTRKQNAATTRLTIAGHTFDLRPGRTYLATRPLAHRGMKKFDVTIQDITNGFAFNAPIVATVPGLSYDAANALLAAFNDGESRFSGRTI
jgi:hypothetical protein